MEITINNFRGINYYHHKFNNEITLLKGESGKGKSSIFEAIKWVLYGGNKNIYPIIGKKESQVELKFKDILIVRKKPSDILTVKCKEISLEGEEANQYIINYFGSKELWTAYSYLGQGERHLLLSSNQNEKIELIKELIYGREKEITQEYYAKIRTKKDKLEKDIIKLQGASDELNILLKNEEDKNQELLSELKSAKKAKKLLASKEILEKNYQKLTYDATNRERQFEINQKLEKYQCELIEIKEKIKSYPENLDFRKVEKWKKYNQYKDKYQEDLEEREEDLDNFVNMRGKAIEKTDILKRYNLESSEIKSEIKKMEALKEGYYKYKNYLEKKTREQKQKDKINEVKKYISSLEEIKPSINKFWNSINSKLGLSYEYSQTNLQKNKNLVSNLKEHNLVCPECRNSLVFKDNKLQVSEHNLSSEILEGLSKKIAKIETYYSNYTQADNKLQLLVESLEEVDEMQEVELEDISEVEKKLSKLYYVEDLEFDLDYIDDTIKQVKRYRYNLEIREILEDNYYPWYQEYQYPSDINNYYQEFNQLNTSKRIATEYISNHQYCEIMEKERLNNLIEKIKVQLDKISIYEKVLELDNRLSEIRNKIKDLDSKKKEVVKENNSLIKIEKIIKETETQFLERAVDNLNFYLNQILSYLFDDILIEISMFKRIKKDVKPHINIKLKINGLEYDNLSYLSGGEKDRISLALTIALNKLQNGPIMLLDEVMASLDSHNRQECLKVLKRECKDKITINICHETIEGYYDKILDF